MIKPKLLLHACCAPCSAFLVKELSQWFRVTVYFSNSNIWPFAEYTTRLEEAKRFFEAEGFEFLVDGYNHQHWLKAIKGLEREPEKGKRCEVCYRYRLQKTVEYAEKNNFNIFGSSLSISPHKVADMISTIGNDLSKKYGIAFLDEDWKKKDRFKRAMAFSRECGFYHQNYCGCEFSRRVK